MQNNMGISTMVGWDAKGDAGIVLILPRGAVVETPEGPQPCVVISPGQARELAYAFLCQAEQLENGSCELPPRPEGLPG